LIGLVFVIACCISFVEIVIKYSGKNISRLLSPAFFLYIGFNIFLAICVYYVLTVAFKDFQFFISPLRRALAAGLGYSLVFKSKIFDINVRNKRIPLGPAFFYQFVTGPLLHRINNILEDNKWKDALEISSSFPHLETYVLATNTLWRSMWKVEMDEREHILNRRLRNLRNRIYSFSTTQKSKEDVLDTRVVRAAMLLIDHFGDKKKILKLLDNFVP
jgi:hypothetical protein